MTDRLYDEALLQEAHGEADAPAPVPLSVMQVTWSLVAGGAENYALSIASSLDRRRFRCAMCAVDQGGALEPEVRRRGLRHFVMHRRPGIQWGLMWRLFQLFRREGVDVVHTHHFAQLFYSALPARLAGARIIHTEHSVEAYKRRPIRVALRLLSLLCDKVTVIGADGLRTLRERVGIPARKLQVIRAGVAADTYGHAREDARRALDLAPHDRVATIVARLYPEKNHLLLLEAWAAVARQVPHALLLIVGEGTEQDAIRQRIGELGLANHVRMLGVRRDVPRILAASDVFVLCSDREGLPIAALEAMAARLPVVATAVGDLPLVVSDGENGLLVPPKDAASLGTAIAAVLSDSARAAQLGQRGRQLVQRDFSIDAMIEKHEQLYEASRS